VGPVRLAMLVNGALDVKTAAVDVHRELTVASTVTCKTGTACRRRVCLVITEAGVSLRVLPRAIILCLDSTSVVRTQGFVKTDAILVTMASTAMHSAARDARTVTAEQLQLIVATDALLDTTAKDAPTGALLIV